MKVNLLGKSVEVIETDDENIMLTSGGKYDVETLTIHVRKSYPPSLKNEILFHEIYEFLLGSLKLSYGHDDFQTFSTILWATLKDNGMMNDMFKEENAQ